ncbi:MAG: methyltransferase domain-containing protein [Planctomycetota bacterium]
MAKWYDYPQYFDMLFRDETVHEVRFFEEAFERYGSRRVKRVFEPGCGSGRLIVAMAAKGYDATGLDLSEAMLDYMRRKLRRRKLDATCVLGDMTCPTFKKPFDAAFCTFNTFRHLLTEKDALAHLHAIADLLREGSLYIISLHLVPEEPYEAAIERYKMQRFGTTLWTKISVPEIDEKKRLETLRVDLKAKRPSGEVVKIRSEFPLRIYTPTQLKRLLKKVDDRLELVESFDMSYDIDEPLPFDKDLVEALLVLRKRA